MTKKEKIPGVCIFCNQAGVTKQHMFPDWLSSVLPREEDYHSQATYNISMAKNSAIINPNFQKKRGHVGTRKIRKVCKKCNSGWMSILEMKAKPFLTKMILNEDINLDKNIKEIISIWIIMTSIVAEYTDLPHQAIPFGDRISLMSSQKDYPNWQIWIGRYKGNLWKQRYRHHGMKYGKLPQYEESSLTQVSTFALGSLFIYAASSTIFDFNALKPNKWEALLNIWPLSDELVSWQNNTLLLDDNDALNIADSTAFRLCRV